MSDKVYDPETDFYIGDEDGNYQLYGPDSFNNTEVFLATLDPQVVDPIVVEYFRTEYIRGNTANEVPDNLYVEVNAAIDARYDFTDGDTSSTELSLNVINSVLDTQTSATIVLVNEKTLDLFYEGEGYLGRLTAEDNPDVYDYYRAEYTGGDTDQVPVLGVYEFVDERRINLQFDEEANGVAEIDPFANEGNEVDDKQTDQVETIGGTIDPCIYTGNCNDPSLASSANDGVVFGVLSIILYVLGAVAVLMVLGGGVVSFVLAFTSKIKKWKLALVPGIGIGLLLIALLGTMILSIVQNVTTGVAL